MKPDVGPAAAFVASPNHGERAGDRRPDMLVLHYTGMASGQAALDWLCNPSAQVSCHYFVREDGSILQLVPERRRAWHAGASSWEGERDINSRSIGIEIVNAGHPGGLPPFPDAQIAAVVSLCRDIVGRHSIAPRRVLAHSDIAPGRKIDPGEVFPWERLHACGVGHWVEPAAITAGPALAPEDRGEAVAGLQRQLADYGYGLAASGVYDAATELVVEAFQRHFRPARIDGIADPSTRATVDKLMAAMAALTVSPSARAT